MRRGRVMSCSKCGADIPLTEPQCPQCGTARVDTAGPARPTSNPTAGLSALDSETFYGPRPDSAATAAGGMAQGGIVALQPGQRFGTRYSIIKLNGVGGMGAVYHAWDDELGVPVALKVIRPDTLADPATAADVERRFKRELLIAREVTHKNVIRIHDLGEVD